MKALVGMEDIRRVGTDLDGYEGFWWVRGTGTDLEGLEWVWNVWGVYRGSRMGEEGLGLVWRA